MYIYIYTHILIGLRFLEANLVESDLMLKDRELWLRINRPVAEDENNVGLGGHNRLFYPFRVTRALKTSLRRRIMAPSGLNACGCRMAQKVG